MEVWLQEWDVVAETRDTCGEGPLWVASEMAVYWVDISGCKLHRLVPGRQDIKHWDMPSMVSFVAEREAGGLVLGLQDGVYAFDLHGQAKLEFIVDPRECANHRINDATISHQGELWLGTMIVDASAPDGKLVRIDAQNTVSVEDRGYFIPNGPAFNRASTSFFHADSIRRTVYRFRVDEGARVFDRATHLNFPEEWGLPDGMTVDSEDHLWVAHWDGARVSRFDPDGVLVRTVPFPVSRVTCPVFGGENYDRMFVTSAAAGRDDEPLAGALFEIDPGTTGFPQAAFGG